MRIPHDTRLFFDASVLVADAYSTRGGSALLLEACKVGGFRAQATSAIFLENLYALREFPPESLRRFYRLLVEVRWELLPVRPIAVLGEHLGYIAPKDAHVLAAAVEGQAQVLATLDRRHIMTAAKTVERANFPIIILRPGDFIREYYPGHVDYPDLPPTREQSS